MLHTELEENLIKAIGLTGDSRMKELKNNPLLAPYTITELNDTGKKLEETNYLHREVIRIGGSLKHTFNAYELTEKGMKMAQYMLNQSPVLSEKKRLLMEHDSLEIGYIVKDCTPLLKEKGIHLAKGTTHYTLTYAEKTHPLFIDTKRQSISRPTKETYFEVFDQLYAQSATIFYLSTSHIASTFLILDEVEAWMKSRILGEKKKPFQLYTSSTGRILKGNGDQWDSLIELWNNGIERFGKLPSI